MDQRPRHDRTALEIAGRVAVLLGSSLATGAASLLLVLASLALLSLVFGDGAGNGMSPFVRDVALFVALSTSLLGFLAALWFLRSADLRRAIPAVVRPVLVASVLLAPLVVISAPAILLVGLVALRLAGDAHSPRRTSFGRGGRG